MDATSVTQFYLVWSHNENIYDFRCDQWKYNFLTMPIIWFLISTMCFSNRSFQIDIVSTFIYLMAATLEKKWPWQKNDNNNNKIYIYYYHLSLFPWLDNCFDVVFMMPALIYDNSYTYVQSAWMMIIVLWFDWVSSVLLFKITSILGISF